MFKNIGRMIFAFLCVLPPTRVFWARRWALIMAGHSIGRNVRVCGGVKIFGRGKLIVGDNTWVGIGTVFFISEKSLVKIGKNVDIAPYCIFHNGTHELGDSTHRAGPGKSIDISISDGVWIGFGSKFIAGTHVAEGNIVGAGSVLIGPHDDRNSLIACKPASVIKYYE